MYIFSSAGTHASMSMAEIPIAAMSYIFQLWLCIAITYILQLPPTY